MLERCKSTKRVEHDAWCIDGPSYGSIKRLAQSLFIRRNGYLCLYPKPSDRSMRTKGGKSGECGLRSQNSPLQTSWSSVNCHPLGWGPIFWNLSQWSLRHCMDNNRLSTASAIRFLSKRQSSGTCLCQIRGIFLKVFWWSVVQQLSNESNCPVTISVDV